MKYPDKLYVAQTAPDKLDVVNENYPNATEYVRIDKLEEWLRKIAGEEVVGEPEEAEFWNGYDRGLLDAIRIIKEKL